MADTTNIPTGLTVPAQIPLDTKVYKGNETELAYLGPSNVLAYTYFESMHVVAMQENTEWVWREVQAGEENTGLVPTDFMYPFQQATYGIDYSGRKFNFFPVVYALPEDIKDIVSPNSTIQVVETSTQWQIQVATAIANGSATQVQSGFQTTVTGLGTIASPYIINGRQYTAGTGISITGTGVSGDPYVFSINDASGSYGWKTGDVKEVVCDSIYLAANFNGTGLGINDRVGWAIMNGQNGTPNDDGLVTIAYGVKYNVLEATGGEEGHVLTIPEIPAHNHSFSSTAGTDSATGAFVTGTPSEGGGTFGMTNTGGGLEHNNMQPYRVRLRIMKL